MLKHKNIDRFCYITFAITLIATLCLYFFSPKSEQVLQTQTSFAYENDLFDQSKVHTLDILMDNWDSFVSTCYDEKTVKCDVIIDGQRLSNVGIKAKGCSSVFTIALSDLTRYGFKISFDEFNDGENYQGLHSLILNNGAQDATYMKDYLAYNMMRKMDVPSPLCSFINIKVNGEDKGLYLAVEPIDENFLRRNYGADYGKLYKPDIPFSTCDLSIFIDDVKSLLNNDEFDIPTLVRLIKNMLIYVDMAFNIKDPAANDITTLVGNSHINLEYVDDKLNTYSNIFNNAIVDITVADQRRFIHSLKALSDANTPIEDVIDTDALLRFLTVHSFVNNGDSYIGLFPHNYYLYEKDGRFSFIPWDYNLGFGYNAASAILPDNPITSTQDINWPIDTPLHHSTMANRPLIARIFKDDNSIATYHSLYNEFLNNVITSGWLANELTTTRILIAPYVAKDPTAFYTYQEFEKGVNTLESYCALRAESISKQLDGTIPSTAEGQAIDSSNFVDASSLDLSDMGYLSDTAFFKSLSTDNKLLMHKVDLLKDSLGIEEGTSPKDMVSHMNKQALFKIIATFFDLNSWAMIILCFITLIIATRFVKRFNNR